MTEKGAICHNSGMNLYACALEMPQFNLSPKASADNASLLRHSI